MILDISISFLNNACLLIATCKTGYSLIKKFHAIPQGEKSMNISVNSLLNYWSDIYLYGHTLLGIVNISFA